MTLPLLAVDNVPPDITCPNNIFQQVTTGNQNGATVFWNPATASDNSGAPVTVVLVSNPQQGPNSFFIFGSYTITYTATDAAGNINSCSFSVTVGEFCFTLKS